MPELTTTPNSSPLTVFVLSDSSGQTAESVAKAALVQFPTECASIYRLPQVRNADHLKTLILDIAATGGLVAYTFVLPALRKTLELECQKHKIPTVDILGSMIASVSALTKIAPLSQPGRLHLMDEKYFARMAAVDFAIRFDDGKQPEGLTHADVVIIGVSRTSKTPNCIYLAHNYGLKAANIPLIKGIQPSAILFKIPANKIIGLTIDPHLLHEIRLTRAQVLGMTSSNDYADLARIKEDIKYASQLFQELGCHIIDVSAKAVEETASEIYLYLRQSSLISNRSI